MASPPNILVLLSDQHNKAVMGCSGDAFVRTPNLDALAREGVRFPSFYTNSPLCVPARCSFLTGRLPGANRVWHNQAIMDSGVPTWAHALSTAGYETALIGRMHFEGPDQRHGFTLRPHGEPFANHPGAGPDPASLYLPGIPSNSGQNRNVITETGMGKGPYEVADEATTDAAVAYLRGVGRCPERRPFAAVAGFILPHCPYIGDPGAFRRLHAALPVPRQPHPDRLPQGIREYLRRRGLLSPLPEDRIRAARAAYYAMVESLDRMIGRILETLDEAGLGRDTLVIYTSDHGEMAGEHACWNKSCFYEGSVGVPFLARFPGVLPAGSACARVASLMELFPTFAELAGIGMPGGVNGTSLLAAMRGEAADGGSAVSEILDPQDGIPGRMLREGPWKIWEFEGDAAPVLFNLEGDPGEETDLGSDHRHAGIRDGLLSRLREGWEPAAVRAAALRQLDDYRALAAWGRRHRPRLPDATTVDVRRESFTGA